MAVYFFPAIFMKEDVGYSVRVPSLPGCFSQGDNLQHATEMASEAIGLMLEGVSQKDYPEPVMPSMDELDDGDVIVAVPFDKTAYDRKYNSGSVRRNVSLPKWLDSLAAENNLSLSTVLQKGLRSALNV